MLPTRLFFLLTVLLAYFGQLPAQEGFDFLRGNTPDFGAFTPKEEPARSLRDPLNIRMVPESRTIQPGRAFWVAVDVDLDSGWHTYWTNPGDSGMATSLFWQLPEGVQVSKTVWPTPKRFEDSGLISLGYDAPFTVLVELTPSTSIPRRQNLDLAVTMRWVACNAGNCIPGDCGAQLQVSTTSAMPVASSENKELFRSARETLPQEGWELALKAEGSSLEFQLSPKQELSTAIHAAYFYPLEPETSEHRKGLKISRNADDQSYLLTLAETTLSKHLMGVLVLQGASGDVLASLHVDHPIDHTNLVALASDVAVSSASEAVVSEFEGGLGVAILFAFLGGMILNLMPCVLPVISLKVLSIVKMAGQDRSQTIKHGLVFALGVLVSFWALAGALLVLQAYGHSVGWGFQLQEPIFVGLLAAVILVFALSLFGVFELGTGVASWAGQQESQTNKEGVGYAGSFCNGILATAVATPCTGPFLGSAIGFAVTLPPFSALLVFTFLGAGMAFPYVLLTAFPSLTRWLPKPGNWMVTFKQLMGFLLMATILWLLFVFGAQTSTSAVILLLAGLFALSFASWIYGRWSNPTRSKSARTGGMIGTAVFALLGTYLLVIASSMVPLETLAPAESEEMAKQSMQDPNVWLPFSAELVDKYRNEGHPIFVDFTAKWCVICQTNHYVLVTDDVAAKFREKGVIKFKADWTRNDPAITKELRRYGRSGVPLYLLYAPGSDKPEILPQVLTPDVVNQYIDEMGL